MYEYINTSYCIRIVRACVERTQPRRNACTRAGTAEVARQAHIATLSRNIGQMARGHDPAFSICSAPGSVQKYGRTVVLLQGMEVTVSYNYF